MKLKYIRNEIRKPHESDWIPVSWKCSIKHIQNSSESNKHFIIVICDTRLHILLHPHNYKWTKRTKFLLTVIYGLLRGHSNNSKIKKKMWKIEIYFYDYFQTSWIIWNDEPAGPLRFLTVYFSESIKDRDVKISHKTVNYSLEFVLLNCLSHYSWHQYHT